METGGEGKCGGGGAGAGGARRWCGRWGVWRWRRLRGGRTVGEGGGLRGGLRWSGGGYGEFGGRWRWEVCARDLERGKPREEEEEEEQMGASEHTDSRREIRRGRSSGHIELQNGELVRCRGGGDGLMGGLTGLLCRFGCILRGSLRLELGELEPSMRRSGIVYLWSWLGGGIRDISGVVGGSRTRKRATCSGEVGRGRSRYAININRYTDMAELTLCSIHSHVPQF